MYKDKYVVIIKLLQNERFKYHISSKITRITYYVENGETKKLYHNKENC